MPESGGVTYLEAIRRTLRSEMERDERVLLLGEDIGAYGGAFRLTEGLLDDFGPSRVMDTPISEEGFTGMAVGLAFEGFRPVVEFQFMDFIASAFNMIVNFAAKSRYRAGVPVPLVLRGPAGGGVGAGPFHSANPEAWFAHAPGIKVVAPATVADAAGLLRAAIRDDDPTLYLEHKRLYRSLRLSDAGWEAAASACVPLGKARRARSGGDVSLVAYGGATPLVEQAAAALAGEGIEADVLDLRSLVPLDLEAILASAERTGRLLVVHEANRTGGFGGEIVAQAVERAGDSLMARRVAARDAPTPYAPELEAEHLPSLASVVEAARELARERNRGRTGYHSRPVPTDVIMPQMGESITEGTITKWRVAVGDAVARDDPLFDIATDKVDTEVPAALSGRLAEILVPEGETVEVNTVVGRIAAEGEAVAASSGEAVETAPPAPTQERSRPRSSPLVRRMAREHGLDLADVPATGEGGRVTKQDIQDFLKRTGKSIGKSGDEPAPAPEPDPLPVDEPEVDGARGEPLTPMRRAIAEHMVRSRRTAAHVTTVFEADMSRVVLARAAQREEMERRYGIRLTLMPYFATAALEALAEFPILNASLQDDRIVHHSAVHLGIAVALPDGLVVPVLRRADERNFVGIARGIAELSGRARKGELELSDLEGGTFTITNPGPYGALFGTPIIAQPQSAILGIGGVHKRAVVLDSDAIAVRSMVFLALSFDHRLIDGAVADRFMGRVKERLENWPAAGDS